MKLASGQHSTQFIQIEAEIYILRPVIAVQSTATTHKLSERTELQLCSSTHPPSFLSDVKREVKRNENQ